MEKKKRRAIRKEGRKEGGKKEWRDGGAKGRKTDSTAECG